MKSIFDMTGPERAAALLVALGPDIASDIIKYLDEKSVDRITAEIAKIQTLSVVEKEDLVGEFLIDLRKSSRNISGGEGKAREILVQAFGEDKAVDVLKKFNEKDISKAFEFLEDIDTGILASFLKDEYPQIIAVVLSHLPSARSGEILKSLDKDTAKNVAIRMAKMDRVSPDAIAGVAKGIRIKYEKFMKEQDGSSTAGGMESLLNIMSHLKGSEEKKLMDNLDKEVPILSESLRKKIFTFENIVNLANSEMRVLIDEINDDDLIARSLKGAGDEIRFKFLRNMSRNRATDIINDMKIMGPIRLSEVEESRDEIVNIMRTLHDNGIIHLTREEEPYVE